MPAASNTATITVSQSNGNSDEGPSIETVGKQARKDRKRATDRAAQREHRRRQKHYVEDLEAQIRVLKQQYVANQAGGTLVEENERLRKELKELKALFSTIESLVKNQTTAHSEPARIVSVPEPDPPAQTYATSPHGAPKIPGDGMIATPPGDINAIPNALADHSMGITQQDLSQNEQPHLDDATHEKMYYQDSTSAVVLQPNGHSSRGLNVMRDWWGISSNEGQNIDHVAVTGTDTPTWLNNFFAIGSLSPSGQFNDLGNPAAQTVGGQQDFDSNFPPQAPISDMGMDMTSDHLVDNAQRRHPLQHLAIQESSPTETYGPRCADRTSAGGSPDSSRTKFEVQIHRSLPHVLMPPLPQDLYVHEIIERARSNALSRRMLLDAPTLAEFLVDNSTNVLSSDLKKYLEPVRRSRRTAEYLGTYWVSYLLLRWQVNQSEESYARIPAWFRPTDLQMHIPHPIGVDFVAWPRLRDELVKLSQSQPEKVHEILTTIGIYLELHLESTTTESLTNGEVLNAAVCDLRNWRLRAGFYDIYPQWRGMCERVAGVEGTETL